jgi:hypothetical membrane protein
MKGLEPKRGLWANLGLAGPLAAGLFAASVVGFASVRTDGYAHATKAVSELGAVGAPSALAFNLLGFIVPGLLVILLTIALRRAMGPGLGRVGPTLLALSGLALIAAGVFPVDMDDPGAPVSVAHFAGAMLTGVFWSFALFWIGSGLRRVGFQVIGRMTPWFVLFPLANVLWQVVYGFGVGETPGWGQRIGFLGYFVWLTWLGLALYSEGRRIVQRTAGARG